MTLGNDDLAMADFIRAIQLPSHNDRPYLHRGTIKHRRGNLDGAVDDYSKALDRNPVLEAAWFNRAVALRQLGHLASAVSDLEVSHRLSPESRETKTLLELTRQELAASSTMVIPAPFSR